MNNTQIDNAKEIGLVMPMCNLIEYSNNYLKTIGGMAVLQRCRLGQKEKDRSVVTTRLLPSKGNG